MDDQERNLLALEAALRMPGREVICVRTGRAAIDQAQRSGFAVAVLDVMMPGVSGIETARALRLIDPSLPIIFVTALPDDTRVSVRLVGSVPWSA